MNFVVIDSGSTKADWAFCVDDAITTLTSEGINLATKAGLNQNLDPKFESLLLRIDAIYFYGAGANIDNANDAFLNFLSKYTTKNINLEVESDLLGAARACSGDEASIVCILGTGSNSGLYDGKKFIENIPSLGYIISDEGSGNHIGKEILKAYFYKEMRESDIVLFESKFQNKRSVVLEKLYKEERPSAYLASYAEFLQICSNDLKIKILSKVFNEFIEIRIKKYKDFRKFDIYFIGSIAYVFQEELLKSMNSNALNINGIIKNPIQNLIEYHKSRRNY